MVSVVVSGNAPDPWESSSVTSKFTVADEPMSLVVGEKVTLAVMYEPDVGLPVVVPVSDPAHEGRPVAEIVSVSPSSVSSRPWMFTVKFESASMLYGLVR